LKPHGRRWHAEPDSQKALKAIKDALPTGLTAKILEPSLEDVFLKIVEPTAAKAAPVESVPAAAGAKGARRA
jgi:hypothetical protein